MGNKFDQTLTIQGKTVGAEFPTYFIADIAANHDSDLERAKDLIYLAAEAGADAAKFQHFSADTIVSDRGFRSLGGQQSHQSQWKKSVFEVYKDASLKEDWTPILKETCDKAGITFFTSAYSVELVDSVDPFVPAYKIGSGDITWHEILEHIAKKNKPVLLATGASSFDEVAQATRVLAAHNSSISLLQCNTNYTASLENFKYIQLNVLNCYKSMFPGMVLGLSDHTPGHATVLGAISLGARIIEKHFTDDTNREGPDHRFSMDPRTWKDMVERSRELELALGNGVKEVENNERETVVLQRRALRSRKFLVEGSVVQKENMIPLRPCPTDAISPDQIHRVVGKRLIRNLEEGDYLKWSDLI